MFSFQKCINDDKCLYSSTKSYCISISQNRQQMVIPPGLVKKVFSFIIFAQYYFCTCISVCLHHITICIEQWEHYVAICNYRWGIRQASFSSWLPMFLVRQNLHYIISSQPTYIQNSKTLINRAI